MTEVVLTTFNARYAHASFGLRYLHANLRALRERAAIVEFEISTRPIDAIEKILTLNPRIVGVGVYIWNALESLQLVSELKRLRPDITVIIGGPEVSYEVEQQEICRLADYVLCGEADIAFANLCEQILSNNRPLMKVIQAELPQFETKDVQAALCTAVELPYDFYDEADVAHRVIYVEASRGCPFKCEFCLSSLDVPVRNVPLDSFLPAMQRLLDRGVKHFKFVDRTFNLNLQISRSILAFFLERYRDGLFLHFEMIPDRLPEALRDPIKSFPDGALQFEVGVQTFNDDVAHLISRRQDNNKLEDNLTWLRSETGVHVHADLILGLPGEDIESFGRGFDRLVALKPQEIQVGMLKRLRGTPIVRHDATWGMVYSPQPPYEILQTKLIDFVSMQRMRRFARYWDLIANSGNFAETTPLIWGNASPFESFLKLSAWLHEQLGQTHAIALPRLAERVFEYLSDRRGLDRRTTAEVMWSDYSRGARRDVPEFLRGLVVAPDRRTRLAAPTIPRRQARHQIKPL
ncbi:B12-binding domain-containing radical SAM protein [soil metagenome]